MEQIKVQRKGTSLLRAVTGSLLVLLALTMFLYSCSLLERTTNTRTYVITPEQLEKVREEWKIDKCPEGQTALAFTIQGGSGGATVTVRCQ